MTGPKVLYVPKSCSEAPKVWRRRPQGGFRAFPKEKIENYDPKTQIRTTLYRKITLYLGT